tara:strand:- start:2738 stop:3208 length:471 start_codon:yes stop_codon:yes gene_type:complete
MKEFKGDKRTKEYREWKQHQEALQKDIDNNDAFVEKGLGDKVEEFTAKTGIKKAVEWLAGEDCGCNERKVKLNKAIRLRFPVVRCFTEQQYNTWKAFRHEHYNEKANEFVRINAGIQKGILIPIYAQLFSRQLRVMSCCVNSFFLEIDQVYKNYKK